MSENSQNEIFISVRDSMVSELSEGMRMWNFSMMLDRLREEIDKHQPPGKNNRKVRFFSRNYLRLSGERFVQVQQWLKGKAAMSDSDIRLVLTTLLQLENGTFPVVKPYGTSTSKRSRKNASHTVNTGVGAGARRKIVDLILGTLNSFVGVTAEMKLAPDEVLDGDRMQMVSALQNLCRFMGISIQFARLDEDNSVPVKPSDMKQLMKGKS